MNAKLLDRRRVIFTLPILLWSILAYGSQLNYLERSTDRSTRSAATFVEIQGASRSHLLTHLQDLEASSKERILLSDSYNFVLSKYEAFFSGHRRMLFLSDDPFGSIRLDKKVTFLTDFYYPGKKAEIFGIIDDRAFRFTHALFYFKHSYAYAVKHRFYGIAKQNGDGDVFLIDRLASSRNLQGEVSMLVSSPSMSILNRRRALVSHFGVREVGLDSLQNYLVFVDSEMGETPRFGNSKYVSLYQLESDYFSRPATMAGIGRLLLFQVLKPSSRFRVEVSLTSSLKGDGANLIPPVSAVGVRRRPFAVVGRGAAQVFSPPIEAQSILGNSYFGLDMGVDGKPFPEKRLGPMGWFHKNVPLDGRRLVGFGRDFSILTEQEYARMRPPSFINDFPSGLLNPDLEFSGVYEDGWLSNDLYMKLAQPKGVQTLSIRGLLPHVHIKKFKTVVRVSIDGAFLEKRTLSEGDIDERFHIPGWRSRRLIRLSFSREQALPGSISRLVTLRASYLGFGKPDGPTIGRSENVLLGGNWYAQEQQGGVPFRWVDNDADFSVVAKKQDTTVKIDLEPGPAVAKPLLIEVQRSDSRQIDSYVLYDRRIITLHPSVLKNSVSKFLLHVRNSGRPLGADSRTLNFRVFRIFADASTK